MLPRWRGADGANGPSRPRGRAGRDRSVPPVGFRPARVVDWGCPLNALTTQTTRANTIVRAVTSALTNHAARTVRSIVEDAGGDFSGLAALTARAKVRSVLNEDPIRHVIQYRATVGARDWQGPADAALQRAARRVTRAIGSLLPDTACLSRHE